MRNKKIISLFLGALCLSFTACSNVSANSNRYTGTLESDSFYITSEVSGKVNEVDLQQGAAVKKNDIAAKINADALKLQRDQAEGGLEAAKAQYDSLPQVADENKKKQLEGAVKQAQAAYDLANLNVSKSDIKSENSGVVSDVLVHSGEMVQAGANIAKVLDTDNKYIKIYVEQSKREAIKLNDKLNIYYNDKKIGTGEVIFISPEAEFTPKNTETKDEKNSTVFEVKIRLPKDLNYSPGTLMDVEVRR